jgi:N-acyl-L-homoserine lactone synthetase
MRSMSFKSSSDCEYEVAGGQPVDERFECGVVTGAAVASAIDVRRRVYVEEFGFDLGGSGWDEIDDRAFHLLATTSAGAPVASLRLVDEDARPFEVERFLEIEPFLPSGGRVAEITRLCVLAPYRRMTEASLVHLAILRGVFRLTKQLGVTEILASTRPDLAPLYDYLLFEMYPNAIYEHPEIGGQPHTLMHLNLDAAADRYQRSRRILYEAIRDILA